MTRILKAWSAEDKKQWFEQQVIKRSYLDQVVSKIESLKNQYDVVEYGRLSYGLSEYSLYLIRSLNYDPKKKNILITGGVHGYETSGVQGALKFLENSAFKFLGDFNFIVTPCISPWGYETINRWNPQAIDPNRSFYPNSPSRECELVMNAIANLNIDIYAHFDLHETTDTDNTVFRPALEKRDGIKQEVWDIPDGFYLVGDSENPSHEFQKAIIESVKEVTHIAPSDEDGKIIGEPITQEGVINYPIKKLNLCASFSQSDYCTTTEVYPDSPKASDEICALAQVAAIAGGLEYLNGLNSN